MTKITRSSLDRLLSDALSADRISAPMPEGLLRVPDGWTRGRGVPPAVRALASVAVVAAAAIGTLAVVSMARTPAPSQPSSGSDAVREHIGVPIERLDLEPRPGRTLFDEPAGGPVIEVARGSVARTLFDITVYRAEQPETVCLQVDRPFSGAGASCGSLPGEGPLPGSFGLAEWAHGAVGIHHVAGLVATDIAEVWIETAEGRAEAVLIPLHGTGVDAVAFIAFLPAGVEATAMVTADEAGNPIDRLVIDAPPPDVPGPMPTPAPGG